MNRKAVREAAQSVIETNLNDRRNFKLVSTTLSEDEAIAEASRCLLCDEVCDICTTVCPNLAFHSFETLPVENNLQKVIVLNGEYSITEENTFKVGQRHQIIHIADWCNQCGNCTTFCPTSGSPYIEKPHIYLSKKEFDDNKDGYFLDHKNNESTLLYYDNNFITSFQISNETAFLESINYKISMDSDSLRIIETVIKEKSTFDVDLTMAATMKLILQGLKDFYQI